MLHFMLDAYDTDEASTNNLLSVNEFLVDVSEALQLKTVMPPFLVPYYYSKRLEDGGISAFLFLEGGHITIHTFPYLACYFVDITSNDFFSTASAENSVLSVFQARSKKSYSLDRRLMDVHTFDVPNPAVDFGPHYMITVNNFDMSFEWVYTWLDSLAPKINMEAITRPYVIYSTENDPQFISGLLVVAQSHVAVHYNIKERLAYIDIFSCSFLENTQIEKVLNDSFGEKAKYRLFVRGSKHEYVYRNSTTRIDMFNKWQRNKR